MARPAILPDPAAVRLTCLSDDGDQVVVAACASAEWARCPACGAVSHRVHSWYARAVADLPWQGVPVRLRLRVRRFFCANPACGRRIFAERLAGVVVPYGRRTVRLEAWLRHVAFALGGRPGARLLRELGLSGGRDALLARVRAFVLAAPPTPRVLSVDDFALRRGRTYGTILVDLERRRVVDLLPDRSAATLASWLAAREGVQVIARDRGGEYADGARRGAPAAVQVADRFHLLRNLGEVVGRVLRRHADRLRQVPAPTAPDVLALPPHADRAASRERTRRAMAALFEAVQGLAAQGMNLSAIARALRIHRHTARKYRALPAAPERRHVWRRPSILAPHHPYLLERWRQGCRNALGLWRELAAQGYPGAYREVARFVAELKRREKAGERLEQPPGLLPRQAVGLLLARPAARTAEEQATVGRVLALDPEIRRAAALLDGFAGLIRGTPHACPKEALAVWEADAAGAALAEVTAFLTKLRQDREAVLAALALPYSQGPTEGHVNRLKAVKRAMYGRARFDLLRKRVLYAAA
jgi:transposase